MNAQQARKLREATDAVSSYDYKAIMAEIKRVATSAVDRGVTKITYPFTTRNCNEIDAIFRYLQEVDGYKCSYVNNYCIEVRF